MARASLDNFNRSQNGRILFDTLLLGKSRGGLNPRHSLAKRGAFCMG
jgi:hypothetical protein